MANIHFERRKKYASFSIILSIVIILILVLFIPQMLISRTKTIINSKLERASADTTYIKLIEAGYSYLQTADAFVIFKSRDDQLRNELKDKALERFRQSCKQVDSTQVKVFCEFWAKILDKKELAKCQYCSEK